MFFSQKQGKTTSALTGKNTCHLHIARAKGMAQVARDAGLSRESLYKSLSGDRIPGFDTVLKIIKALGLKLHAEAGLIPNPSKK